MRHALIALGFLVVGAGRADDGGEAVLKHLAKISDLIVVGEVAEAHRTHSLGVGNYLCGIKVTETIKGPPPKDGILGAHFLRVELDEKAHAAVLKPGSRCILFLKNDGTSKDPEWINAERWFSAQPYDEALWMFLTAMHEKKEVATHARKPEDTYPGERP